MSARISVAGLVVGQHGGVEDGRLLGGGGVGAGADLVKLAVHVVGRASGRAFEGHVLQKMAYAGDFIGFVAGAGLDDEAQRSGIGIRIALGNDFQAVRQEVGLEVHKFNGRIGGYFWMPPACGLSI